MTASAKPEAQPTVVQTALDSESVDDAWSYLNQHHDEGANDSIVDIAVLRRKIDWRIVPLMFGCYTMQFLDKVILNVSRTESPLLLPAYRVLVRSRYGHSERPSPSRQRLLQCRDLSLCRVALL